MDALKCIKTYKRMCHWFKRCDGCPLNEKAIKLKTTCIGLQMDYSEDYVSIIEKWAEEHPLITNAQHYAEVLRKVGFHVDVDIMEKTCPIHVSPQFLKACICKSTDDCDDCRKWWNEEYIPSEKKSDEESSFN